MTRVVLPLTEQRSPGRAARVVGALRMDLPLRVGLARLNKPRRRPTLLQDPGCRTAVPVEFGCRVPALDQEFAAKSGRPFEIADEVMRLLRVAELADARIGPGTEVLALSLP